MKISLRRRHAQIGGDGAFSHKMDCFSIFYEILNLEGHQNSNPSYGNGLAMDWQWILPIGGASAVEGLRSTGLPHLVFI